ncbi:PREDICTED: phosphatidylinositol 3-kinase catalytic subunit type 3-like, partial [Rhagoletis zephyria]|uniref:phosphatidylinositol 3-kinase catalytic subunit type 3-like n=1 Tax=Rhagoletis zephyria TaxID=28612 RepID=UPI0008117D54
MDAYTFKYVYTCDIEEIGFRVKVGNLDGIFPPSAQTDNAPSKRQQSPQSHNKSHYSSSSTIQNNYNYNVVEVLEELSLIDDLASSDEESSSTQEDAASASPKSTAENTDSIPLYVESLNKRQKEHKSQQKKSQKLSQIIFGGLSQPQASSSPSSSSTEIAFSDLDFNHRDHRNKHLITPEGDFVLNGYNTPNNVNKDTSVKHTPPQKSKFDSSANGSDTNSLNFTSTTQYMQNDLSLYPDGNCGLSKKVKQLNKLKKKYYNGQIPKVTWLDKLTFLKIEHIIVDEKTISTLVFLTVEFPVVVLDGVEHCVVYYEDKEEHCCQYDIIEKEIVTIQDPEISLDNLVEQKHHKLARSARSGISDRDLKPNATIRNQLNDIVSCPSTKLLTSEEQDLVWKFRFYLCTQKKALTKFLKTVNWNSPSEVEQAINLMEDWAPMDVEDALELLSPQFRHPIVRKYAVSRLKEAVDEELLLYLLQLVQALKYESFIDIHRSFDSELTEYRSKPQAANVPPTSEAEGSKGTRKLFEEGPHSTVESFLAESIKMFSAPPNLETFGEGRTSDSIPPYSSTNSLSAGGDGSSLVVQHGEQLTSKNSSNKYGEDLATFLINRACSNDSLANYLFWYLMVECDDRDSSSPTSSVVKMYQTMMMRFSLRLFYGGQEMFARRNFLIRQYKFVEKLVVIMKDVARESGNRTKKIEKLQTILSSPEPQHRFNFSKSDPLPLPLNPDVKIVGVVAKEATLFKSAMMPAKLAFYTTEGSIYSVIFKHGDDLRQDDLVLQMIILMDKLLRMENLDLKLTAYRVLATGSKHGFVQFIDSQSVAEVLSIDGTIQNYLRKISTNANSIAPEVMDAYVKSCAGYCIITYLLGVGDRHLDNLMMTKTGRLFHIDFGFILGRDPKLRPPPMKITREMVDAMGGMSSENFARFCNLVRTAFLHLRRHANLILNLFSLMVDANVPDIALEPDKTVQKVQDKFKLELNDEQAVHHITEQVEQSVRSIMPVVVDQLHKMTQ